MFIDKSEIYIKAGNGGNGCVAFHREKYVAQGGPSGGDGGNGGNVIFVTDEGENTLLQFKYRRKFAAANGEDGKPEKFHGKTAGDLIIKLPQGTLIKDAQTGKILYDMGHDGRFVAAKGGRGGFGNTHFATPTRQVPRFAKSGTAGQERTVILELKLLADVGLVGFPNVGKSTLLSMVSAAKPKIANYHFTTLSPMLGVVAYHEQNFVMADIPGLIEGASDGMGLGHQFLRHVDRCRLLVHVVDISSSEGRDPVDDIDKINAELYKFNPDMIDRHQIIAANKCDLGYDEEKKREITEYASALGYDIVFISAAERKGIDELLETIAMRLRELPPAVYYEPEMVIGDEEEEFSREVEIKKENGIWFTEGKWLKNVISSVNLDDRDSLAYFQKVLKNADVFAKLEEAGVVDGDTVNIYGFEFDYIK